MSFATNGKKFSSILKELPNDELTITINDSYLIDITSESKNVKGHYTLFGLATNDYPEIPRFVEDNSVEIEQGVLKEMMRKVMYAASGDSIKPLFNGIYFVSDLKGRISSVGTDSRRLSLITRTINQNADFGEGIIIPLKTMHEIYRLLESSG